jgi:DNA-binding MarR family transcriptional regulator
MDPRAMLTAIGLIHQVSRELTTTLERQLAPHDITAQQAALLINAARGQTSPKQLAPLLGTDTAGMTRLLDRLEAKGLAGRRADPGDRRALVIEVTEQGRALVPVVAPVFGRTARLLLGGFSATETEQLTALLDRILSNLHPGGSGAQPSPV